MQPLATIPAHEASRVDPTGVRTARRPRVPTIAPDRFVPRIRPGPSVRVALCVPTRGCEGIWGPSCIASAELAAAELNAQHGILGRPCELLLLDASEERRDIGETLFDLVEDGAVDALVGMHLNSVRQRITAAVGGRLLAGSLPPAQGWRPCRSRPAWLLNRRRTRPTTRPQKQSLLRSDEAEPGHAMAHAAASDDDRRVPLQADATPSWETSRC